jgi:hypothetical protein
MIKKIIFISIFIFTGFSFGQTNPDSLKCNRNILLEFDNHLDSLNNKLAKDFLHTFDKSCSNNVEFSEWSNELLFQFIEHYPDIFIKLLSSKEIFDTTYIYKNLETPVNDGINLEKIRANIKSVKSNSPIKAKLLECINNAISKN